MNSPNAASASRWHILSSDESLARLNSTAAGLTTREAEARLEKYGLNQLQSGHRVSPWSILFAQFKNVLIIILLLATAFSAIVGHGVESIAIAVIVLFAVLLGFIQEFRAERAIEALSKMAAPMATVLRDGIDVTIPAQQLVPGDVILLHAGDRVPADARILESINLKTEEAALTGESEPIAKQAEPLSDASAVLGDQTNMLFAGTAASYGRGKAVVVATGMETEFGRIAGMLQSVQTGSTPLQMNLDKVGRRLAQAGFAVVAMIVVLGVVRGEPWLELLIFGIALAVAVVPEALPAVVTISLAIGVQRMAKRNALVRRLPAVETLGSTSVICSDKTGTLTRDEMTARRAWVAGETWEISGAGYDPHGEFLSRGNPVAPTEVLTKLLTAAVLSSDAALVRHDSQWSIKGDSTEGALIVAAAKLGLNKDEVDKLFPRVDEIPFTSESKRMTTLHKVASGLEAYSKGAPEFIIRSCTRQLASTGEVQQLDHEARQQALAAATAMANDALRILAVAYRQVSSRHESEEDMTLLGLIAMNDPPRPEARQAVQSCEAAGIKPVMITGDHPTTAEAIARELGILKQGRVVTGVELEQLAEADFARQSDDIEVYARVSPQHKLRIVAALQQKGHIVAMTGDGVNDAPALKKADIGIAMGITGTDVTKEAAAMTLTDDNFATIVAAIEEGRIVFGNIKKYLMYLLSANIGEIGLMAGASVAGLPLPLTAVQLLYVNLATDGLPALALAVDPPESDLMTRKPRDPKTGIFTRPVVFLMLTGGIWSAIVNLGLYSWAITSGRPEEQARTMAFFSLVLIEFFKAYNYRSDHLSLFNRPLANKWLNLAMVWEFLLLGCILYFPFLQQPFKIAPLSVTDWLLIISLALTISPVLEFAKWIVRRGTVGKLE